MTESTSPTPVPPQPPTGRPAGRATTRPRAWAVGVAVVLIGLFWTGYRTTPAGPASGVGLRGDAPATRPDDAAPGVIRIGSFNVHGAEGTDGRRDHRRVAADIAAARLHVVALQEVHARFSVVRPDTAAVLSELLDMPSLFAPTERRWWRDDFGNGALCALPVDGWARIPLAGENATGYRNVVLMRVRAAPGVMVNVLMTHIDRQAVHDEQLRTAIDLFRSAAEPAVLLGDLNTRRGHPILDDLLASPGVVDAVGARAPADDPGRIDWVITRGMEAVEAGIAPRGASDHRLVWAAVRPVAR